MSFLDIKDPAERATLVKEYVTAMKTVKQRNMTKRESELPIGVSEELQTYFRPIVNATKQAAEVTRKELVPMKETLTCIDRAWRLNVMVLHHNWVKILPLMGNKIVQLDENKKTKCKWCRV